MTFYKSVEKSVRNYRADRDRAMTEVRIMVRDVQNTVCAYLSAQHEIAQAESREVNVDLSVEGLRQLVVTTTIRELGGVSATAIDG